MTDEDAPVGPEPPWLLTLYVSGASPRSAEAIDTTRRICDEDLGGHVVLEIVDVAVDPALAAGDGIVAVPTLVRRWPYPLRKLTGDLAHADRVRAALEIPRVPTVTAPADRGRPG